MTFEVTEYSSVRRVVCFSQYPEIEVYAQGGFAGINDRPDFQNDNAIATLDGSSFSSQ